MSTDRYQSSVSFDTIQETDARRIDYDDGQVILTTLPQSPKESIKRDGEAECMCTGWFKRTVVSTPGFPSPIIHPKKVVYEVRKANGRGMGVFATENIEAGDLIVAERPLVVRMVWAHATARSDLTQEETMRRVRDDLEATCACMLTLRTRLLSTWRKQPKWSAHACHLRVCGHTHLSIIATRRMDRAH